MATFVVTGATKAGIGEAVTRALLTAGHTVIGTVEAGDQTSGAHGPATEKLQLYTVEHAKRASLDAFCQAIAGRPIDGLVNAQMFFNMENQSAFDHALWDQSLSVNLTMPNHLVRTLSPQLSASASLVMITSTEAFMGSFGASAYASTKAAIHNLVKTWANLLGSRGIRANALAAGWIGGVMDTDEVFNLSREITPLRRLGAPDEVASVVSFLLGSQASFVNGTVITVDGGYSGVDRISKHEFESSPT